MVSGVGVMVSAFCLARAVPLALCSMTQPVVTPVGRALSGYGAPCPPACCPQLHRHLPRAARHQTLGGRVTRPSGPSCGFVDSHDLVPAPVRKAGGFTRRLRRPTAGASHAPSGAASPLCRGGGLFAQEARSGVGRPCLLPTVPCSGVQGCVMYERTRNVITKQPSPIFSCWKCAETNTEI